ncbi:hypothetical protein [Streptomyces sp. SD15]
MTDQAHSEQVHYLLEHLAEHLSAGGDVARLRKLIAPDWLDRKREHLGLDAYQSLARDVTLALTHWPEDVADLPAFLRLSVLAATLNATVTELPPESLTALARDGRMSPALASVAMITTPYEQARALQAIARGRVAAAPGEAAELWRQSESLAAALTDHARAGRLLAAAARGLTELGTTADDLVGQAGTRLAATATEGASSWLLVTEAHTDLAAADPDPRWHLTAALTALHHVDHELDDDNNPLIEPLRALVRSMAAAGDRSGLDRMIDQIASRLPVLSGEREHRPRFARYGRALIALAVVAVGAAEGGEPERARAALDRASGLGSGHRGMDRVLDTMLRDQDFDDPTTWNSDQFSVVTRAKGRMSGPRLQAEEAAILAWASALVLPEDGDRAGRLVAAADWQLYWLSTEEQRQLARTRFGPTRLDALNQEEPLDPSIMQDEQERNLLTQCYAAARLATALHHVGDTDAVNRRFTAAITQTARLVKGHGGVVEVLLDLALEMRAGPEDTSQMITTLVDTARLDFARALDTALDGTLDFSDLVRRVAPARASAGDSTGLRLIAARAPAGRQYDSAKALLAYQLARTGDTAAAQDLAGTIGRDRVRAVDAVFRAAGGAARYWTALANTRDLRRTMGSPRARRRALREAQKYPERLQGSFNAAGAVQTWTALADTHRVTGSPRAGRRALRRALKTTGRLDGYLNPPKQVMPLYAAMIRPTVGLGQMTVLDRILRAMSALGDPELMILALADAVGDLADLEGAPPLDRRPLSLPDEARILLSRAALTALDASEDRIHHLFVVTGILEDLGDVAATLHAAELLEREESPAARFRGCTALIRIGPPRAVDTALALIRSPDLATETSEALNELLAACAWAAPGLSPLHVQALRELVEERRPNADSVAVLIELGLALPPSAVAQDVLGDAARHAHRLRGERPELLASLARSGNDPVSLIAQGAVAAVGEGGIAPSDRGPSPMTSYLMAAAPAARELDPALPEHIWAQIHDLRTFRRDPQPTPARPPTSDIADIAGYVVHRILIAALYYPVSLALTWLAVGLMAHLGGGERGPVWTTAGVALIATAARLRPDRSAPMPLNALPFLGRLGIWITTGVTLIQIETAALLRPARSFRGAPPPRRAVPLLGALVFGSLVLGGWCLANGFVRYWFPHLFHGSSLAVAILFGLMTAAATLNVAWFARRLWTGGDLPYKPNQSQ